MDDYNNALHALNTKGTLLALQFLDDLNIGYSHAICLDNEGFLLIGNHREDDKNGEIHVVKIAERFM